jgi:hypothetical protein
LEVGKRWTSRTTARLEKTNETFDEQFNIAIVSYEEVEVPLGRLWAYKFEVTRPGFIRTFWAQPGWGIELKSIADNSNRGEKTIWELVSRSRGDDAG